ncbi:hypothetical protein E4U53_003686 [Claviceps sorghi]|nr:hypothetical protein E4U53_003686 [Claviceps sorghi]
MPSLGDKFKRSPSSLNGSNGSSSAARPSSARPSSCIFSVPVPLSKRLTPDQAPRQAKASSTISRLPTNSREATLRHAGTLTVTPEHRQPQDIKAFHPFGKYHIPTP